MAMTATARVLDFPGRRRIEFSGDGPEAVRICQSEILRSGWFYSRIALESGLCNSTIHNIASGTTTRPSHTTIIKILTALGWKIYGEK